ncbi:hypothetical protein [Rhizobium sp. CNPSo 3490]|uniref:hypothetical protein n=1 Tax=Rhizobium sp. CNPSo 3490 TaxID=3021407 RepID=UPI00254E27C0|nr:hypothetical protein [Rhizobium sp. CNPSo 3490]MDK4732159.1 hypothetical protein [Rhizobium sp. CNPSo 3490]
MAQQKPSRQTNVDLVNGVGQRGVGDLREKTMEKTQKQLADGGRSARKHARAPASTRRP